MISAQAFGREGATRDECARAARLANAYDFISGFPDGFDTEVGDCGVKLSGGQRQQITLPMGGGNPTKGKKYDGKLDYVLTQKLCIGPPTGRLSTKEAVAVKSDTCNTEYTVEYLSNQY